MTASYRSAGAGIVIHDTKGATLYGGEEAHYANKARNDGMVIAHLPAVFAHHLGNEERHPDYPGWKWFYGYMAWTRLDMTEWLSLPKGHPEHPGALWLRRLFVEISPEKPNDCNLRDCLSGLCRHGIPAIPHKVFEGIEATVRRKTENGVVLEAMRRLKEIAK
jgi:hypothetical protein